MSSQIHHGRRLSPTLVAVGFLVLAGRGAGAQQPDTLLRERPKSQMRSIVFKKLFTIDTRKSGMDGSEQLKGITRTSAGQYYLGTLGGGLAMTDPTVTVLTSAGRVIKRLGRKGSGPGEFLDIQWLATGPGDTVYVLDRNRVTVYLGLKFIRVITLPSPVIRAWPLAGRLVTWPAEQNLNFRVYDRTGVSELGVKNSRPIRVLGPFIHGGAKSVWIGEPTTFRFEQWSPGGKLLGTFVRNPEWFGSPPSEEKRYGTLLMSLHEDRAGRVWCFYTVLSKAWRPTDEKYDTMIEVFDPRTREVIASQRLENRDYNVMSSDLAVVTREDDDGFNLFDVYEFGIK